MQQGAPSTIQLDSPKNNCHKTLKLVQRKVQKALEINRLKTLNETDKTFKLLNKDDGDFVPTNSWKPFF